jgi:hypothetical protein
MQISVDNTQETPHNYYMRIPWNKGVPCSEETKLKIGLANKGKASFWKGKRLTPGARKKLSAARMGMPAWNKGLTAKTDERIRAYAEKVSGSLNRNWRGGCRRTLQNIAFKVWEKHRGEFPNGKVLHHIDGDPTNNSIENLACVTWSRHEKIHQRNTRRSNGSGRFKKSEKECAEEE